MSKQQALKLGNDDLSLYAKYYHQLLQGLLEYVILIGQS